jgi:tRNA modification GTPase
LKTNLTTDTIAAVATPPGRGGIGIVRLSGPAAKSLAETLLRLDRPLQPARAVLAGVLDPANPAAEPIDEAVVTSFQAPHSYTGDDVVEIAAHGSPVVLDALLRGALKAGARLARPGEFTERAFLNGRIDLTQAEAVHDLIAANTLEQARMAAWQLGGALSRRVAPVKEELLTLIALLEAGMDFAPGELDDVDVVATEQIRSVLSRIRQSLEEIARSYTQGRRLREGASVALVGRPNVGKSSLFNRLLERDRAIVTPLPGTTRDTVEELTSLAGIPLRLIDTAGLRLTTETPADAAEALGIARSREALAEADLVLLVLDAGAPMTREESSWLAELARRPHVVARNKIDLLPDAAAFSPVVHPPGVTELDISEHGSVLTSAITGQGLPDLRSAVLAQLGGGADTVGSGVLNSLRQQQSVAEALEAICAAQTANDESVPHEFLLADLHGTLRALDALTGATTSDDILGRIFSTFCIGK